MILLFLAFSVINILFVANYNADSLIRYILISYD